MPVSSHKYPLNGYYQEKKYIRMAGNTAYNGVLEALDGVLEQKKKGEKVSIGRRKN